MIRRTGRGHTVRGPTPAAVFASGIRNAKRPWTCSRNTLRCRLDISEYDDRCRHIANARVHGELSQVFLDLPRIPRDNQEQPSQALAVPGYGRQIYTAEEVAAAAGRGRNIRGGIMALSVVTAFMLVTVSDWFLWIIPVVAILLYMLKIGPSSWYMPTNRQIQREQRQALRQQRQALRQQRLQRRIDGH